MATITISLTGTVSNDRSVSRTISNSDTGRLLNAYRIIFGQVEDPPESGTFRDRTNAEIFDLWANGLFEGTKANVKRQEQLEAAKTASDTIVDIGLD